MQWQEQPAVIPRACGVSSTPRLLDSITAVSGILDRPVKPGDDGCRCGARLDTVIASASEAIHGVASRKNGLLRRFAPRNDEALISALSARLATRSRHLPLTSCTRPSCCDFCRLLRSASRPLTCLP